MWPCRAVQGQRARYKPVHDQESLLLPPFPGGQVDAMQSQADGKDLLAMVKQKLNLVDGENAVVSLLDVPDCSWQD